jgi:site-specific DNA-methyltransferase (adenine-specific)
LSKFDNFRNYNPDILETIANLSNDEVFTPPKLANDILDLLPEEIWKDSTITFLDPAVKTGIFLREIASRLIAGLADEIPDLQERVNHILTKQIFGIGITELTTLMARRTVYCSMTANGPFSIVTEFDDEKGNIIFPDTEHTWDKNGRCKYCGANSDNYGGGTNRENYAYPFIHDNFEKEFGNMKFDVIIGNPPYQLNDGGGSGDSAVPLYNKFIEKAKELSPKFITMIVPSRWMKGGKGLSKLRKDMIEDTRIKRIVDYQDSKEVFPSVNLDGGICYFLWDKNFNGKVKYTYNDKDKVSITSDRYLKEKFSETIIRDPRQLSILEKVYSKKEKTFDLLVSSRPFGFGTDLFNNRDSYPNIDIINEGREGYVSIYGVEGNKGGAKRVKRFVSEKSVSKNKESIYKYKLFFPGSFTTTATVPPEIIQGYPGSVCTQTFLKVGDFATEEQLLNCLSYIKSKFFRALLYYNRVSFGITMTSFSLIPLQDFSKPWTDEELYKKYKLTQEEIDYIEDNIDPMD